MSRQNKKCLKMQSKDVLQQFVCFGRSKHQDKLNAIAEYKQLKNCKLTQQEYVNEKLRDKIYSINTYKDYVKHINYFLKWCEDNYKCKTLKQCEEHINEWLQKRIDANLSAYTVKLEVCALGKLFQKSSKDFNVELPVRERKNITRSRGRSSMDYGFSLKNNKEIINFCRGTGLRRSELENLKKDQLWQDSDKNYYIKVKGKGGKTRDLLVIGPGKQQIIEKIKSAVDGEPVWENVPRHMDVHAYRSDYATALYYALERENLEELNNKELYFCRGDRKGTVLDRKAMQEVSKMLGHNRIDVIASHYIR